MTSSLSGIVAAHRSLLPGEADFVLATVVETRGSTYRKPGARMLGSPAQPSREFFRQVALLKKLSAKRN